MPSVIVYRRKAAVIAIMNISSILLVMNRFIFTHSILFGMELKTVYLTF